LLDYNNRIIEETIANKLAQASSGEKLDVTEIVAADFDGVKLAVISDPEVKTNNILNISIAWRCFQDCAKYGALELLQKEYGSLAQATPQSGYDFTAQIDLLNAPDKDKLPNKLSLIKRHVLAAPFYALFDAVEKDTKWDLTTIQYRDNEALYLKKIDKESCLVIFSVSFADLDDITYAKVFLQEYQDARKQLKGVPAVNFSQKEAPLELKGVPNIDSNSNNGFVSFVLFKNQIDIKNRDRTINNIQTFRNYLHYHIKCSKGYMHMRMRKRVETLLQVLNRAKMEFGEKEKKTIGGKTFVRK